MKYKKFVKIQTNLRLVSHDSFKQLSKNIGVFLAQQARNNQVKPMRNQVIKS